MYKFLFWSLKMSLPAGWVKTFFFNFVKISYIYLQLFWKEWYNFFSNNALGVSIFKKNYVNRLSLFFLCSISPIKMCIKYAPYLYSKSANQALNMVLFDALVLLLLTKFVPNGTIRRCCFRILFLILKINYPQILWLSVLNSTKKGHNPGAKNVLALKCTYSWLGQTQRYYFDKKKLPNSFPFHIKPFF